jgi:hypothetical protein
MVANLLRPIPSQRRSAGANQRREVRCAENENMRYHQGGRKQLFAPAQTPCLLPSAPIRRNLYVSWG